MDNNTDSQNNDTAVPSPATEASSTPVAPPEPATPAVDAAPSLTPEAVAPVSNATPPAPAAPRKASKAKLVLLLLLIIILCASGTGVGGYLFSNNKAKKDELTLNNQIAVINADIHTLPAGATKVSDCIPGMGIHYLPKTSDPIYGPFILTNKEGKVIAMEYMVSKDMYTPIPNTNPPVELVEKNSSLFGWKFDHIEFSHLPKGHEGYMVDHNDIHLYTVTADQEKKACI